MSYDRDKVPLDDLPPYRSARRAMQFTIGEEYADNEDYRVETLDSERFYGDDAFQDADEERRFKVLVREFDRGRPTVYQVQAYKHERKRWNARILDREIKDGFD